MFLLDIMVCTGCCGTLDFIVTHLFKTLSKRRKKNLPALDQQPPCLRILESHPEMIQQVCARDFSLDLAIMKILTLTKSVQSKVKNTYRMIIAAC